MCNACGFWCCAHDGMSGCRCDHCDNLACWSDDDDYEDDDLEPIVDVGDGLHQVLADALKTAQ